MLIFFFYPTWPQWNGQNIWKLDQNILKNILLYFDTHHCYGRHMKAIILCWKQICMQPVTIKQPKLAPIIIRVWKKWLSWVWWISIFALRTILGSEQLLVLPIIQTTVSIAEKKPRKDNLTPSSNSVKMLMRLIFSLLDQMVSRAEAIGGLICPSGVRRQNLGKSLRLSEL